MSFCLFFCPARNFWLFFFSKNTPAALFYTRVHICKQEYYAQENRCGIIELLLLPPLRPLLHKILDKVRFARTWWLSDYSFLVLNWWYLRPFCTFSKRKCVCLFIGFRPKPPQRIFLVHGSVKRAHLESEQNSTLRSKDPNWNKTCVSLSKT